MPDCFNCTHSRAQSRPSWRARRRVRAARRVGLSALFLLLHAVAAQACPMCSQSIAEQRALPQAYMYSILFMLGMPAVVLGGIGGTIYWKFRQFHSAQPESKEPAHAHASASLPVLEVGRAQAAASAPADAP
jgi:hypothetical protein